MSATVSLLLPLGHSTLALRSHFAPDSEEIMPLVSIPAIYDGKQVRLLQTAPVEEPYYVVVTFVEPTGEQMGFRARFWASFGAWQDDRSVEDTLQVIHQARRSKTEPPPL